MQFIIFIVGKVMRFILKIHIFIFIVIKFLKVIIVIKRRLFNGNIRKDTAFLIILYNFNQN